jgi:hypothetical protein
MEPHVVANQHLAQLTDADRRRRDQRAARIVSRVRTFGRRRA